MTNPVSWFEIASNNLNRSKEFYATVFQSDLQDLDMPEMKLCMFPGDPAGAGSAGALVQYTIEGRPSGAGASQWASEPNMDGTVELAARYGYHVDQFTPPAWAHQAVIYQVFVDRFTVDRFTVDRFGVDLAPEEHLGRAPSRWLAPSRVRPLSSIRRAPSASMKWPRPP